MTNETPDTLKQLLQILEKQGTANDDITGNSRNHWSKIAAKGLTRRRFKPEPCVICKGIGEMHHHNYRKPLATLDRLEVALVSLGLQRDSRLDVEGTKRLPLRVYSPVNPKVVPTNSR